MSDMFTTSMNSNQLAIAQAQAVQANAELNMDRSSMGINKAIKTSLDKNDFLAILIQQLANQDPTSPMEDKEFIAQMAQFSSLEQITNMSGSFDRFAGTMSSVASLLSSGQAINILGREVDVMVNGETVSGKVSEIQGGDYPMVKIGDSLYDLGSVVRIKE